MTAIISACGRYRYTLERSWEMGTRYLMFVMLNPSTADAEKDDPTIRRCIGFAKTLGFDGLLVGNLYALRATYPRDLKHNAPCGGAVGPENDTHLALLSSRASMIIAAWGQPGPYPNRAHYVIENVLSKWKLLTFGLTKSGHPRHPLRLPKTARPELWNY